MFDNSPSSTPIFTVFLRFTQNFKTKYKKSALKVVYTLPHPLFLVEIFKILFCYLKKIFFIILKRYKTYSFIDE